MWAHTVDPADSMVEPLAKAGQTLHWHAALISQPQKAIKQECFWGLCQSRARGQLACFHSIIRCGFAVHTIVAADGVLEPLAEAGQTLHIAAVVQIVAGQVVQIHLAPGVPGGLGGLDGSLLGGLLDTEIRWDSGVKGFGDRTEVD